MFRPYRAFVSLTLLFVLVVMPPALMAQAVAERAATSFGSTDVISARPDRVDLLVGRSTVVRMDRPIIRVSLSTADIADAMVTSPTELLIHGKAPGTISLFVWADGGRIKPYDIVVSRDLSALDEQVKKLFPGEPINVASNGKNVVLSGVVSGKYIADRAAALAVGYVDKPENVVNLLRQQEGVASDQVMLQVRFAEVSRSAMQELGSSYFTGAAGHGDWVARGTTQQFPAPDFDKEKGLVFSDFLNLFLFNSKEQIGTLIKALSSKGLFQSLAEPNLVTQDGKEASFLAGGEYPYPVVQGSGQGSSVTIVFKEFGVRLRFTPTIMGDLIHLKVAPEVSTLDFSNAIVSSGFRIPSLSTRKTDTEVELRDGQTFAVAGLMDNRVNETMSKMPGIGDIPILGLLFRSRAYQKNSTELVVMITPHILPRNSPGVSPTLPAPVEPFLSDQKRRPVPPPAFSGTSSQVTDAQEPATAPAANNAVPTRAPVTTVATPSRVGSATAKAAVEPSNTKANLDAVNNAREQKLADAARRQEADRAKNAAVVDAKAAVLQAQHDREQDARARADEQLRQAAAQKVALAQAAKQGELDRKRLEDEKKQAAREGELAAQLARAEALQNAEQAKLDAKHQEEERKLSEKSRIAREKLAKERQAGIDRYLEQNTSH